jgi:hypothetical protein
MSSIAGPIAFQARRQALINLALKRDPLPLRQKPAVSFVDEGLSSTDGPVNELPPFDTQFNVRYPSQVVVDGLPTVSPTIKATSARTLSTVSYTS